MRGQIDLDRQTPDEPVSGSVDVGLMEQILVNIMKNVLEACSPGNTIELGVTSRQLLIRNNGDSLSPDAAAHLFDPFFSTKCTGQGIGLTLAHEILLNHGFAFALRTGRLDNVPNQVVRAN